MAAAALSLLIGTALDAKSCTDPKTHKFVKCPPPAAATTTATTATTTATTAKATTSKTTKVCKTGKPCGNSCIAKDKVCHK
jgi:hypothetical protein